MKAKADHPILAMVREFKKEMPMFHWTADKERKRKKEAEIVPTKIKRARISIRPDNIADLLKDKLDELPNHEKEAILSVGEMVNNASCFGHSYARQRIAVHCHQYRV